MGKSGSGHAMKCINNIMMVTSIWMSSEALLALIKYGIKPEDALAALNQSSGRNWATMQRIPDNILNRSFNYGFSLELMAKDVEICMRMFQTQGVQAPLLSQMRSMLQISLSELGKSADHVEIVKMLEKWAGQQIQSQSSK